MTQQRDQRSLVELFGDLSRQMSALVRQEIDLVPPQARASDSAIPPSDSEMSPGCPQGVVSATGDGFEEPPAPGLLAAAPAASNASAGS